MKNIKVQKTFTTEEILDTLEAAGLIKQGNGTNYYEINNDGDLIVICEDRKAL